MSKLLECNKWIAKGLLMVDVKINSLKTRLANHAIQRLSVVDVLLQNPFLRYFVYFACSTESAYHPSLQGLSGGRTVHRGCIAISVAAVPFDKMQHHMQTTNDSINFKWFLQLFDDYANEAINHHRWNDIWTELDFHIPDISTLYSLIGHKWLE